MKTATLVEDNLPGWKGDAKLFKMEPPYEGADHVAIVTVAVLGVVGEGEDQHFGPVPKTLVFKVAKDGTIDDSEDDSAWTPLPGSLENESNTAKALHLMGYTEVKNGPAPALETPATSD